MLPLSRHCRTPHPPRPSRPQSPCPRPQPPDHSLHFQASSLKGARCRDFRKRAPRTKMCPPHLSVVNAKQQGVVHDVVPEKPQELQHCLHNLLSLDEELNICRKGFHQFALRLLANRHLHPILHKVIVLQKPACQLSVD